jgi:3-hydroxy-9,10-secoandrosta-1,3,5(10)-triene-9,17-dione monooxygenase
VAEAVDVVEPEVPVPEPDLTPAEVIARARDMKALLRESQDESEKRGYCSEAIHQGFVDAGFYRLLQPRRFGGYEFDLPTFWKVMEAISEGDPGTGWYLTLASHHALVVGSRYSERAQRELFGRDGHFVAPHRALPVGQARPVEGGYMVSGTWDYCSGVPYSTHFLGTAVVPGPEVDGRPLMVAVAIPREQYTILDDWGDGATLGMNSSGSNSVRVEDVFVPEHMAPVFDWTRKPGATPGTDLHRNPMYLGMIYGVYHAGLVLTLVGAARGALDEYEHVITTKNVALGPPMPRYMHHDFQRTFGLAQALTDSAEALLYHAGEMYMDYCQRWADTGVIFGREEDARLFGMLQTAGRLASEAVELLFASSGSSAAKKGSRTQRYLRDVAMYRGHIAAQHLNIAAEIARIHFGLPDTLF